MSSGKSYAEEEANKDSGGGFVEGAKMMGHSILEAGQTAVEKTKEFLGSGTEKETLPGKLKDKAVAAQDSINKKNDEFKDACSEKWNELVDKKDQVNNDLNDYKEKVNKELRD